MSSFLVVRRPNDSVLRNSCHGNRILSLWIPWYSPKPSSGQPGTKGNRSKHQTRLLSLGLSDLDGSQHTNNCWQALSSILVQGWNVNLAYGQGKATRCMSQFVSLNKGSGIRKYTPLYPLPSIQRNSPCSQWDKEGSPKVRLWQKWVCLWSLGCEQTFLLAGPTLSFFTWMLWIWTQYLMIWKCSYPMNHLPSPWESNSLES